MFESAEKDEKFWLKCSVDCEIVNSLDCEKVNSVHYEIVIGYVYCE